MKTIIEKLTAKQYENYKIGKKLVGRLKMVEDEAEGLELLANDPAQPHQDKLRALADEAWQRAADIEDELKRRGWSIGCEGWICVQGQMLTFPG